MSQLVPLMNMENQPVRVGDVAEGDSVETIAGEQIVALFKINGELHAIDGVCPHSGGPLANGMIQGHIVTCPWHGWQFDVTTGANCLNKRIQQTCFQVVVQDEQVFVEL